MGSKIEDSSITIFEAMNNIQSHKYVMPAFQRQYEWNLFQIEKLWDSILLDYPISTFLLWHLDENNVSNDTNFCMFLQDVTFDNRRSAETINYETTNIDLAISDTAILDGQQRFTSLYISLFGDASIKIKYSRKNSHNVTKCKLVIELDENKIDVNEEEYNSKKYDIKFNDKVMSISPTQFEIKKIMSPQFRNRETRSDEIEKTIKFVSNNSKNYARDILNKLCEKIYDEKIIRVTEIKDMNQDDALEMFVRFNSGGKKLSKSTITMSILDVYWGQAKTKIGSILNDENYKGFDSDFIIRTALMLYGDVVKSNINSSMTRLLKNNWDNFKLALSNLADLLKEMNIDIHRFKNSWNVLLPIIYVIYFNPNYHDDIHAIKSYLVRAILFKYFASGTTAKLQQMKNYINNYNCTISIDMLDRIGQLSVSDARIEDIMNSEKGSRICGEALYYLGLDWISKTKGNLEQDHLHPYARFENNNPYTVSFADWHFWKSLRNKLPNIHLLEWRANGQKNDIPLENYYDSLSTEQQKIFMKNGMIPENVSLNIENFGTFYEERKKLLILKLKEILN